MSRININDKERIRKLLESRRNITPDNHWRYTGGHCVGYGQLGINNRDYVVSRLSLYIYKDFDINSNLLALHKTTCPFRDCFNPDCLYPGNHSDNIKDAIAIGVQNNQFRGISHCKKGHEFTEANTYRRVGGGRTCRQCMRVFQKRRYDKKKNNK